MSEFEGDWRDKAGCVTFDPELFFPVGETSDSDREQIKKAKVICSLCRVTEQCLQYALETGQDSGIWGGLTESERRELKRKASQRRFLQEALNRTSH